MRETNSPNTGQSRQSPPPFDPSAYVGENARVTLTQVTEAVAEVMRASSSAGTIDQDQARTIAGTITPSVNKALTGKIGSGAELLAMSTFRNILNQHLGSPAASQVDADTRKAMQHTLQNANWTSSSFSALLAQNGVRLASLGGLSSETLREVSRAEGRSRSSTDFNYAFNGGPYSTHNLSSEMRGYIDTARGITAGHVAGVGNYLSGLGINAQQYTGYFVGASDTVRNAIQSHIKDGAKLTDDHIKNSNDVKAIMGAIKAGKIKREDAPPSVQKIMDDMEKKGVDPATSEPKAIDKYFEQNPKALDAVKKENTKDVDARAHLTDEQKTQRIRNAAKEQSEKAPTPPAKDDKSRAGTKPPGAGKTVKLDL